MIPDTQFRAQLADALDEAAGTVPPLDAAAIVADGTRRVRRRRVTGGVLAAIVLGVAGAVGVALGPPAPPPFLAPPTAVPDAAVTATVEGLAGGTYTVTLRPGAVEYAVLVDGRPSVMGRSSLAGPPSRSVVEVFDGPPAVVLGVVPDEAARVGLLDTGNAEGYAAAVLAPLPGTGYAAFGVEFVGTPTLPDEVTALWWRADGVPVANSGAGDALRVAEVGGDSELWVLPAQGLVGFRGPDGAGGSTPLGSGAHLAALDGSVFFEDATTSPSTVTATFRGVHLLRGAASDVRVAPDPRLTGTAVVVAPWPSQDATVVVVTGALSPQRGDVSDLVPVVTSLSWVDAAGVRQEWTDR